MDLPRGVRSGLREAEEALKNVKGVGICRLAPLDVIRHEVVTRIVEAYGRYEAKKQAKEKISGSKNPNLSRRNGAGNFKDV